MYQHIFYLTVILTISDSLQKPLVLLYSYVEFSGTSDIMISYVSGFESSYQWIHMYVNTVQIVKGSLQSTQKPRNVFLSVSCRTSCDFIWNDSCRTSCSLAVW